MFANFKPGTLASLGFSYERLRALNPRIVLAESSAFGATGPWSARMGYGPLVRATTGVTRLWTSEDADPPGRFYDATTIFPDHVVGRITAIAALASLIGRERTGTGAHVHISQAEAAVNQLAAPMSPTPRGRHGCPSPTIRRCTGVFRARGRTNGASSRCGRRRSSVAAVMGAPSCPTTAWLSMRCRQWTSAGTRTPSQMLAAGRVCPPRR